MEDREIVDLYWQRSDLAISETEQKYGRYCHTTGADLAAYEPWSILEDKVCIETKLIFSDGSEFSTGGALTTPYENGTVNQFCGWGSAINIDDVQRIVLGDLVLWENGGVSTGD